MLPHGPGTNHRCHCSTTFMELKASTASCGAVCVSTQAAQVFRSGNVLVCLHVFVLYHYDVYYGEWQWRYFTANGNALASNVLRRNGT